MKNLNFLLENIFRANASYKLVESGNLSRLEQQALTGLLSDPEVYGVFKPGATVSYDSYKVAYKDVALLWYSLQQPGTMPIFLRNIFDDDINATLASLILDGILEIKYKGEFFSGPGAQQIIFKHDGEPGFSKNGKIASLSGKAIRYVFSLNHLDIRMLSARLYAYNTMPGLKVQDILNTPKEVESFLGIGNYDYIDRAILKNWVKHLPTENFNWLIWQHKEDSNDLVNKVTYKMYISPAIYEMPKTFNRIVGELIKTKSFSFKVGADRHGLLRPDKFIAYFKSFSDLQEAASMLKPLLQGVEVQGVPFTAQLDEEGLLSWGVDPPRKEVLENFDGASWRASVTDKIALAISQAKTASLENGAAYNFIMNKISLEGIDPRTWISRLKV